MERQQRKAMKPKAGSLRSSQCSCIGASACCLLHLPQLDATDYNGSKIPRSEALLRQVLAAPRPTWLGMYSMEQIGCEKSTPSGIVPLHLAKLSIQFCFDGIIMHSLVYIIIDAETPCFKGSSNCQQFLFLHQVLNLRERHRGGSPWAEIFLLQDHST